MTIVIDGMRHKIDDDLDITIRRGSARTRCGIGMDSTGMRDLVGLAPDEPDCMACVATPAPAWSTQ